MGNVLVGNNTKRNGRIPHGMGARQQILARIDNVYGDRNLVCACPSIEAYES